jgi:uncharacterized protein YndB with AHSA1/START domain
MAAPGDTSFDFDGLRMNAVKTAENGVVNADTLFRFRQRGSEVAADYAGGGVVDGHLVGLVDGARMRFRYAQLERGGVLNGGASECEIERTDDGRLRLVEHFQWESRPGGGTNVIEELPRARAEVADAGWRALFERRAARLGAPTPAFRAGLDTERLDALERELGLALPAELRALLAETDGVVDANGFALVWDADALLAENRRFRARSDGLEECMAFEELLFFSDAPGNGDAYAFGVPSLAEVRRGDVFRWDHEDDSRTRVSAGLRSWVAEEL